MGHNADDIGIITPYTKQVKKIREKLNKDKDEDGVNLPKVGTVEEFQGQERKIILLSTVRTKDQQLKTDKRYSLGFVDNPKRMNVAISRARALLVIFGNPRLLSLDKNWKQLIDQCIKNKASLNCELLDSMSDDE